MVLANVPSFRFSFRGNMRERTLVPGEHARTAAKNLCCASRVCTDGRAGGSGSKNLLEGPLKELLVQGHNLRLLYEVREVGYHQHPGPENHDCQHMLDQPRGSFPDPKAANTTGLFNSRHSPP